MIPVSPRFLEACRTGNAAFRLTVAQLTTPTGQLVLLPDGSPAQLPVHDGDIGINLTTAIRRDLSCTLADTDQLIPANDDSLLAPFGAEITVYSGWRFADADELVPCGVFRVATDTIALLGAGATIQVDAQDRASIVQPASPLAVSVTSGTDSYDAARQLVRTRYPAATFDPSLSGYAIPPQLFAANSDLWSEAQKIVTAAGGDLFFGVTGQGVIRPAPVIGTDTPTVLAFSETGSDFGAWNIQRVRSSDQIPNGVVMEGNHSSLPAPVRGEAWITDPTSPLRRDGPYGERPKFLSSNSISSAAQATAAAAAALSALLGAADAFTFETTPIACMGDGDVIEADFPTIGASGRYIVTQIRLPLAADQPMQVTAQRRIGDVTSGI